MTFELFGNSGSPHDAGEDGGMGGVGGQFHLVEVQVVKEAMLFLAVGVGNEGQEGELVVDVAVSGHFSLVDEFDGGPDGDGGEGVEDFLDALVEFADVLHGEAGVVNL